MQARAWLLRGDNIHQQDAGLDERALDDEVVDVVPPSPARVLDAAGAVGPAIVVPDPWAELDASAAGRAGALEPAIVVPNPRAELEAIAVSTEPPGRTSTAHQIALPGNARFFPLWQDRLLLGDQLRTTTLSHVSKVIRRMLVLGGAVQRIDRRALKQHVGSNVPTHARNSVIDGLVRERLVDVVPRARGAISLLWTEADAARLRAVEHAAEQLDKRRRAQLLEGQLADG